MNGIQGVMARPHWRQKVAVDKMSPSTSTPVWTILYGTPRREHNGYSKTLVWNDLYKTQ